MIPKKLGSVEIHYMNNPQAGGVAQKSCKGVGKLLSVGIAAVLCSCLPSPQNHHPYDLLPVLPTTEDTWEQKTTARNRAHF